MHPIGPGDSELVAEFLQSMPEGDRTFFKEPIDLATVRSWAKDSRIRRWLLFDDQDCPAAYLAIIPGVGWSSHVGELIVVVAPTHRRRGIGRWLARRGLLEGIGLGLSKLTVEVVADKQGDLEMFTSIGFRGEALLENQIRDTFGELHDLVVLAHDVEAVRDDLELIGMDEALGLDA